jgi:hypothetical protein
MMFSCKTGIFAGFRSERRLGVWVGLLLLLVPFFHPMAEANAAGRPNADVICSSFGSAADEVNPAGADDCPMGINCCVAAAALDTGLARAWDEVTFIEASANIPLPLASTRDSEFGLWLRPPGQGPPASF